MIRNLNILLIVGLSLLNSPSHTKEISKDQASRSSNFSIEKIAEEMVNLNSSLDLLSLTISNIVPQNSM